MRSKEFLSRLDHKRISDAIASAEQNTSGEIRVYIQRGEIDSDALPVAQKKFDELGMSKTAERNGVLILIAPRAQKFAVIGDEGIHQRCGEAFWQRVVETMRDHFKREEFTDAMVEAIATVGKSLGEHFPRRTDDRNELPNEIIEG